METLRRRAILDAHELTRSPLVVQQEFWRRYNRSKGWGGRRAALLGELTLAVVQENVRRPQDRLRRVWEAWQRVLPAAYRRATSVEALNGGELRVTVDSAATKFVLSRQVHDHLLSDLNVMLSGVEISSIRFRVGPVFGTRRQARVH